MRLQPHIVFLIYCVLSGESNNISSQDRIRTCNTISAFPRALTIDQRYYDCRVPASVASTIPPPD